ncbi:MAG: HAD family hydrolase [Gemmatales bacterium]
MNLPKLMLFDFDGTLADGFPGIAASVNAVRRSKGHGPLELEAVKKHVGWGLDHLILNAVPDPDVEADIVEYRQHYATLMLTGTELLPGVVPLLQQLQQAGVKLGVCSNKKRPYTEQLLVHLGILPPIEKVFGPDDVPRHKPAPDMLHAALAHFGTTASDTIYVGDMVVDIQCAHAAGVPVWVVPTGAMTAEQLAAEKPAKLLKDMDEVRRVLFS